MANRVMQIAFFLFLALCLVTASVVSPHQNRDQITNELQNSWVARLIGDIETEENWNGGRPSPSAPRTSVRAAFGMAPFAPEIGFAGSWKKSADSATSAVFRR